MPMFLEKLKAKTNIKFRGQKSPTQPQKVGVCTSFFQHPSSDYFSVLNSFVTHKGLSKQLLTIQSHYANIKEVPQKAKKLKLFNIINKILNFFYHILSPQRFK